MTLPYDPTTQANWQDVASEHVDFDWSIDFSQQTISGSVTHLLRVKKENVKEVMYVILASSSSACAGKGRPNKILTKSQQIWTVVFRPRLSLDEALNRF